MGHINKGVAVPRAQKKKTNALQVPLPRRLSWPCVSDLQSIYKAESWQRAVTLDNPNSGLTQYECGRMNLYCVFVIIVRLN
jgi:hypothetical protein